MDARHSADRLVAVNLGTMVTPASVVRSSVAAPTLRASAAEARTALRLQKQELTNLGVQLARLRSNLEQIALTPASRCAISDRYGSNCLSPAPCVTAVG